MNKRPKLLKKYETGEENSKRKNQEWEGSYAPSCREKT
jgi:hypothetical protein